jgi:hypothetical protein
VENEEEEQIIEDNGAEVDKDVKLEEKEDKLSEEENKSPE